MADIIELNRDKEGEINSLSGLTFIHTADIHAVPSAWDRVAQFADHYDNIKFVLHAGDYCGGSQKKYVDMYSLTSCKKPMYNCVGNHDCYPGDKRWYLGEKSVTHGLLFNCTDNWDVTFMDIPHPMSYYKDFDNLRLIVLDDYYDVWQTRVWLRALLKDAFEKGLYVITAQHETTGYIENTYNCCFYPKDDYNASYRKKELERTEYDYDHRCRVLFEDVICEFISLGGKFICNLAGHDHIDEFGLTDKGVLNLAVQNGTTWDAISDITRVAGERSEDCFNVIDADTDKGLLTVIRIGAQYDKYGRSRKYFVFDFVNKKIVEQQ